MLIGILSGVKLFFRVGLPFLDPVDTKALPPHDAARQVFGTGQPNSVVNCSNPVSTGGSQFNGVFGCNSNTSIANITDGTSMTMLFGERDTQQHSVSSGSRSTQVHMGGNRALAGAPTVYNGNYQCWYIFTCFFATQGEINGSATQDDTRTPSSMHAGGMQVTMADGSVCFLGENTNCATAKALAGTADKLTVGEL